MKIKNTEDDLTLRGVEFPKGKAVTVDDDRLLAKCLNMPNFTVVKTRKKSDGKNEE